MNSCLQGLFLQVIDEIITLSLRGKIAIVNPIYCALSIPVTFFEELKSCIKQIYFIVCGKTLGVLLGLNSGP